MADFPASPKPDYPIEETVIEPEVLVSRHRDGTEQRRLKGPGRRRSFKLRFAGMTNPQRLAIANHYAGENGMLNAFTWFHPERAEAVLVRYGAAPAFALESYNFYSGQVELQEVLA